MDIRLAAYAVITEDDRVLLAHWNDPVRAAWTLPGGGLGPGEDPRDAAVREVLEETGFHVELDHILGVDSFVIPADARHQGSGPLHAVRIVYRAHVVGGSLRNELEGSTDEAAWFAVTEVPTLKRVPLVDTAFERAGIIR
ncbi:MULTISPECIES: NUDIX hydrolase [unclassified Microbacterium]|uniref:NUDIX hydrolase n=1 Tax=unclassified Microbacterium TaxID=2609290 RepID=UPI00386CF472